MEWIQQEPTRLMLRQMRHNHLQSIQGIHRKNRRTLLKECSQILWWAVVGGVLDFRVFFYISSPGTKIPNFPILCCLKEIALSDIKLFWLPSPYSPHQSIYHSLKVHNFDYTQSSLLNLNLREYYPYFHNCAATFSTFNMTLTLYFGVLKNKERSWFTSFAVMLFGGTAYEYNLAFLVSGRGLTCEQQKTSNLIGF